MAESLYLSLPCIRQGWLLHVIRQEGYTTAASVLDTGELVTLAVCPIGEMYRIVR